MIQIKIDQSERRPYYLQIQQQIGKAIDTGELSSDTKLPPAAKWAPIIGVNFHTLNKALVNLTKQGLLYRRRNLGTFVNREPKKETIKKKKAPQSKILVLLPEKERYNYPYTQEVIRGINSQSSSYNLEIDIESIDKDKGFLSWKESSKKRNIKGVIVDKEGFFNKDALRLVEEYKGKTVFFNSYLPTHREIPSVLMDNEKGAYLATEYLIKKGHKRIAILLRGNLLSQINLRYRTDTQKLGNYKLALEKYNLEIKDEYQKGEVYNNPEKIKESVEEFISLNPGPTAILSADDLIAFEVLKILNEKGIKVPEEISLIGFNNFIHSQISQPKLTTVETPMFEMGQKAVDLLFAGPKSRSEKHLVLETKLIERESVSQVRKIEKGTVKNKMIEL